MRSLRAVSVAGISVVLLVSVLAGPAFAPWKGLNIIAIDDGGRLCRDGIEFGLTHIFPNVNVEVSDVSVTPPVVLAAARSAGLVFAPVPERPNDEGTFSNIVRIRFDHDVPAGTTVALAFSGSVGANAIVDLTVLDCRLGGKASQFLGLKDPPAINQLQGTRPVRLIVHIPGNGNGAVFSEAPTFQAIPCAPPVLGDPPVPDYDPVPAAGHLTYIRLIEAAIFRWDPPAGLTGCHEVWFRLRQDGLQHRALFVA
jgi:hypothetical protein